MTANYDASSNRDLGVMILGGNDTTKFAYQVALTNGYGIFNAQPNLMDAYALTARVTFQPVLGFRIGASIRNGDLPPSSADVTDKDTKFRYGFDVSWKFKNLVLMGEYIDGEDTGSYTKGGGCDGPGEIVTGTKNTDGFYAMAVYRFNSNLEPVYKIESYKASTIEGSDIATPAISDKSMCQTFGLNYYPNDWTRLQINYTYSAESPTEIKNDAFLVQLQVKF